jgi:hypothetical protein
MWVLPRRQKDYLRSFYSKMRLATMVHKRPIALSGNSGNLPECSGLGGERGTGGATGGRDSADINQSSPLTEDWCHVVRSWQDRPGERTMPVRASSRFLLCLVRAANC